jgi:hypothetical protein
MLWDGRVVAPGREQLASGCGVQLRPAAESASSADSSNTRFHDSGRAAEREVGIKSVLQQLLPGLLLSMMVSSTVSCKLLILKQWSGCSDVWL